MARLVALVLLAFVTAVQCQGNSVCAKWCRDNFPTNPGGLCTSAASSGTGPCYECGPHKTVPSKILCTSVCVDSATDNNNCGACGNVCGSGTNCTAGVCVPVGCLSGLTDCNGQCVDLTNDYANCGSCGNLCFLSPCVDSICDYCPGDAVPCGLGCANLSDDNNNCGTCGNVCGSGTNCTAGVCVPIDPDGFCNGVPVDTFSDNNNCGRCGNVCGSGQFCRQGSCVCEFLLNDCGTYCAALDSDNNNCGACGNVCGSDTTCTGGLCVL
ncbi:hypothetical protein QBC43DRAFT_304259 [Cladorrhinum sp. PSN259]|nr:hypothetical protein QBC43DRAFT_304259 [Cladorrhinum sp. PSN259]